MTLTFIELFLIFVLLALLQCTGIGQVTVATGERSFSKLKTIKNYLRSSMSQERLSALATLSTEYEMCEAINLSNVIKKFSETKAQKALF